MACQTLFGYPYSYQLTTFVSICWLLLSFLGDLGCKEQELLTISCPQRHPHIELFATQC